MHKYKLLQEKDLKEIKPMRKLYICEFYELIQKITRYKCVNINKEM